jgi:hypothetical protein
LCHSPLLSNMQSEETTLTMIERIMMAMADLDWIDSIRDIYYNEQLHLALARKRDALESGRPRVGLATARLCPGPHREGEEP